MGDRCAWPVSFSIEERLAADPPYTIRHQPVTTVGWGAGNLLYTSANVHHGLALETGSWARFNVARFQVRTVCVDGGLEEDLASTPCLYNGSFDHVCEVVQQSMTGTLKIVDSKAYFSPLALIFQISCIS